MSDKADELLAYDGSVILERTKGEISMRIATNEGWRDLHFDEERWPYPPSREPSDDATDAFHTIT